MMKKFFKYTGIFFIAILTLFLILFAAYYFNRAIPIWKAESKAGSSPEILRVDGLEFRDLNKNGLLDPYEDYRLPVEERVENLLSQMTLEEKAGLFYHTFIFPGKDGELAGAMNPFNIQPVQDGLFNKHMHFYNLYNTPPGLDAARWLNRIQKLAEQTRLGIPVTFSSDPRHTAMEEGAAVGVHTVGFSHWTEPIGFAAIADTAFIRKFGEIAAREYRAIGIHSALHPMVDLATEPRWGRISGTFGEDAGLSAALGAAYIRGFQGDSLTSSSVATMTKHFPGGGPQKDGWDAHFWYGKDQAYPGNNFDYHLSPFIAAIEANTAQMMPYYGVPVGQTSEDVAFAFNREILTDLLRDELNYDGIVCTDWGVINSMTLFGFEVMKHRGFGVDHLTAKERTLKAIHAGVDQFGGEATPHHIVELVRSGELSEERVDESVHRLLRQKFQLGLFDNPFVDIDKAEESLATEEALSLGYESQLRSQVLLSNREIDGDALLPLPVDKLSLYMEGLNPEAAKKFAFVVDNPLDADVIILNLQPPHDPGYGTIMGIEIFREGRLYYTEDELKPVMDLIRSKPTIITTYLERPAILTEIVEEAGAVLVNFGATDEAIFDILFGRFNPQGKLPFDMPSDWESVLNQYEDVPFDLEDPLFRFGFGLSY